jgi:hypothetical protein
MSATTTPENCCSPKDVTAQWLTKVLNHAGYSAEVAGFTRQNVGTGQVGQNVRFELSYSHGEAPDSIVGKFASDDPVSRQTGIAVNDYLKEVLFYQHLQPCVDITTPKIYFSAINLEQPDEFVLMMEDLAPAVQGDQLGGCSSDQASLVIQELAGLAGPRWCDESLKQLDWLAPPKLAGADVGAFWNMLCPGFIERYAHRMAPDHIKLLERFGEHFVEYSTYEANNFTLVHTDYRLDNMMFGGSYPVVIVDWSSNLGTGGDDAAYFMGTGMDAELRRKDERHILKEYHSRLLSYGIDNYTFDACWRDYRRHSFAGLVMAVIASMIVGQTQRGDDMFMVMVKRSADMAIDLEALDLI